MTILPADCFMIFAVIDCVLLVRVALRKQRKLQETGAVKAPWNPMEEIALMLIFPMAGEVFGSFFLRRNWLILLTGCVLALGSVVGAWNRLRCRQKEAGESEEISRLNRSAFLFLCVGMGVLLGTAMYWQYARHWIVL